MLKKIWRWLTQARISIKSSLSFGKNFANDVKSIVDSPLFDVVTALTPSGLDDVALAAFRKFIENLINQLNWADKNLTNSDEVEKTIILHSLSAAAAFWKGKFEETELSLQTTLSTAQLIYDGSKVDLKV